MTRNIYIEKVLTAESPALQQSWDKQEILKNNNGVPTAESPTAKMEVVPTAKSPTQQTSRDKRAIHRNARNPSRRMANEVE